MYIYRCMEHICYLYFGLWLHALVTYIVEMSMSWKCSSQLSWAATSLNCSVVLIRPRSRLNSAGKVMIQYLNTRCYAALKLVWHDEPACHFIICTLLILSNHQMTFVTFCPMLTYIAACLHQQHYGSINPLPKSHQCDSKTNGINSIK